MTAYNTRKGKPSGGTFENRECTPSTHSLRISNMKTYTITTTASTGRTSRAYKLSESFKTIICFAAIFAIYATVDGLADVFFWRAL